MKARESSLGSTGFSLRWPFGLRHGRFFMLRLKAECWRQNLPILRMARVAGVGVLMKTQIAKPREWASS